MILTGGLGEVFVPSAMRASLFSRDLVFRSYIRNEITREFTRNVIVRKFTREVIEA